MTLEQAEQAIGVGALFAVPILGASKAIYLALREERAPPADAAGAAVKNPR